MEISNISVEANEYLLKRRLQQAYAWGNDRYDVNNLQGCLRSNELKPDIRIGKYSKITNAERYLAVETLAQNRTQILTSNGVDFISDQPVSGRLLCFYPDVSLGDGFVAIDSGQFIDDQDCPPWDTWLYFSLLNFEINSSYDPIEIPCLLSWIPEAAIDLVDKAMEQDANDCLIWAINTEKLLKIE